MHLVENAEEPPACIMREVRARDWGVEPTDSYIISSTGKRGVADNIFRVQAKKIGLAEEATDVPLSKAVLDNVGRQDKLPKVIN